MSYPYYCCYCRECIKMDLSDQSKYDSNEYYCTEYRKYMNPNDKACSQHFVYNESLKRTSSCYLTTIVCEIMGLDDNCSILNKMRNFRDEYMKKDPAMYPILYEYDIIGPIIANEIRNDHLKKIRGYILLEHHIKPVINLLDNQKYTEAIQKYTDMVHYLKEFYEIDDIAIEVDNSLDINNFGQGYQLKNVRV